ncbi:MAG: hypothetical protein QMC98_03295, partial [Candidatus Thermoplasmatota archaeon]|nr:hypothetical protein [Candidatus Thermoplasmatota archaeon]
MKKAAKIIGITIVCMLIASALSIVSIGNVEKGIKSPGDGWLVGYVSKYNETGVLVPVNDTEIVFWLVNETSFLMGTNITNATGYYNVTLLGMTEAGIPAGNYSVLVFKSPKHLVNSTDPATIEIIADSETSHDVTLLLPSKNEMKNTNTFFDNWANVTIETLFTGKMDVHQSRFMIDNSTGFPPVMPGFGNDDGYVNSSEVEAFKTWMLGLMPNNTAYAFVVDDNVYISTTAWEATLTGFEGNVTSVAEASWVIKANFTSDAVSTTWTEHVVNLTASYDLETTNNIYYLNLPAKWRIAEENYNTQQENVTITGWTPIVVDPLTHANASKEVSIKVIEDLKAPDAVTGLEPVHGNESVALSWNPSTEADLKHYCVY